MRYKNEPVIWKLDIVTCLKGTHSNKNPNYGKKNIDFKYYNLSASELQNLLAKVSLNK